MAGVSVYAEIHSFISKFMQLTSLGLNGNVNFSSNGGRLFVNLNVDLGNHLTPPSHSFTSSPKVKPSRVRRRKRRENARVNSCGKSAEVSNNDDSTVQSIDEIDASNDSSAVTFTSLPVREETSEEPTAFQSLFFCTACGKAFTSPDLLEQHKFEHDFVPEHFPLICDVCHQSFEPIEYMDHLDSGCQENHLLP